MAVSTYEMTRLVAAEKATPPPVGPIPTAEESQRSDEKASVAPAIGSLIVPETVEVNDSISLEQPGAAAAISEQVETGPPITLNDFEDIFTRYQTPITNFIYRLVGNREDAYDLSQDTFMKAYRALAGGTNIPKGALTSWLYRIASNTATDVLRRRRLIKWIPMSAFSEDRGIGAGLPADSDISPGRQIDVGRDYSNLVESPFQANDDGSFEDRIAERNEVQATLAKLPEKYVTCLLLYEHEGFSCAEIGDMLNLSQSAVKMRLMRARERFVAAYQQVTGGEASISSTERVNRVAKHVRHVLEQNGVAIMSGKRKSTLGQATAAQA